ncbi:MAG: protein kinase [Myxococcales bacterium]|nr:protein kinase [Myxococcales bacterium]
MPGAFGKYELLAKIATGGMGEVLLARLRGSETLLVIKRILPHLAEQPEFLQLFLDEARIAARLDHSHIARVFELGEVGGTWYQALEYVDGRDLRRIVHRARRADLAVPLGAACRIVADAASALDFAHRAKDRDGRPLGIIHRDVSPHNILVSFAGEVKLIDFGVAKAADRVQVTRTGLIRGKSAYMSPEQAEARAIDARSDIFALGAVLWETFTGRRLFEAPSELAILRAVTNCDIPKPSSLRQDLPAGLEEVCLRALQRSPEDRFPDADAMRLALEEAIAREGLTATARDVEHFLDALFPSGHDRAPPGIEGAGPEPLAAWPTEDSVETVAARPANSPGSQEVMLAAPSPAAPDLEWTVELPAGSSATNLAEPTGSFFGRVAELSQLARLFLCGERLVTLLGPGGVGKSRLACRFALGQLDRREQASGSAEGRSQFCCAWRAMLRGARDVTGIAAAVARALGFPLFASSAEEAVLQVGHALRARGEALVVLDGFEHLGEHTVATVGKWLSTAPAIRFLVTSRSPLMLSHETKLPLGPLQSSTGSESSDASRFLYTRLASAGGGAEAADRERLALVATALEGLPLALELAAGILGHHPAGLLLERISAARRSGRSEHALGWAVDLLRPEDRAALAGCAAFESSFTAEAALAAIGEGAALPRLRALCSRFFLSSCREAGQDRFELHELFRAALAQRAEPEVTAAQARRNEYFLELAGHCLAPPPVAPHRQAIAALAAEEENLRAALSQLEPEAAQNPALEAPAATVALALALDAALGWRGLRPERHSVLDRAVGAARRSGSAALLRSALSARGRARRVLGKLAEAAADADAALKLAREAKDTLAEADLLIEEALLLRLRGRPAETRERATRALALLEGRDHPLGEAAGAEVLGWTALDSGQAALACSHFNAALEKRRARLERQGEAALLDALGRAASATRAAAILQLDRAIEAHRAAEDARGEAGAQAELAAAYHSLGLPSEAREACLRAASLYRWVGGTRGEALVLLELGSLEHSQFRPAEAVRPYRRAAKLFEELGEWRRASSASALLAAALADVDRLAEALPAASKAEAQLKLTFDEAARLLGEVAGAHLEAARARAALAQGSADQARPLAQAASKALERASSGAAALRAQPHRSAADPRRLVLLALGTLRAILERL